MTERHTVHTAEVLLARELARERFGERVAIIVEAGGTEERARQIAACEASDRPCSCGAHPPPEVPNDAARRSPRVAPHLCRARPAARSRGCAAREAVCGSGECEGSVSAVPDISSPMLAAALDYAARGWGVFPCRPDKRPHWRRGDLEHGLHDASTDPDVLRSWWARWPDALVGLAAGRSGLVVIDVDVKRGNGFATLETLEIEWGPLPPTRTVATPSGGAHYIFTAPCGVPFRQRIGFAPHIDLKAGDSYVCAPPGGGYALVHDVDPVELPPAWIERLRVQDGERTGAPIPESFLLNLDRRGRRRLRAWCLRALQDEARTLAYTPPGARNDRLWRAAAALGGLVHTGELDADEILGALRWACSTWSQRNRRKDEDTMRRGLAFGLEHPRTVQLEDRRAA